MAFDRNVFVAAFEASIDALAQSEHVTKRELMALSRSVLQATHETGDISYVNLLVGVLTPVNRRVAVIYFKEFTGFIYDEKLSTFLKKSKKHYDEARARADEFLQDPLNNIWSWAARNVQVEQKEFDINKVTDSMRRFVIAAQENNLKPIDVLRAAFKATTKPDKNGVSQRLFNMDDIIAILDDMGVEVNVNEEQ